VNGVDASNEKHCGSLLSGTDATLAEAVRVRDGQNWTTPAFDVPWAGDHNIVPANPGYATTMFAMSAYGTLGIWIVRPSDS
jgi:hypothetical protein